jgi:hypothetical protein
MNDRLRIRIGAVATLGAAVLAGCSGGGQSAAPVVPAATAAKPAPAAKTTKARLNLRIPIRKSVGKSSHRTPKYVSTFTNGIEIVVAQAGQPNATPQLFDVSGGTTTSPGVSCAPPTGDFRICSITVTAPAADGATDSFGVTATDAAPVNGAPAGNVLSTGYATATVVAGAPNAVDIGLTGVIGQLTTDRAAYSIWAAPGQTANVAGSTIVNLTANDFDGGNIAGTQPTFANPIVFADSLSTSSPFTYPSADPTANNYGLPAPAMPGPIPATISYTAATTVTPITTTVTVSTDVPTFLPAPLSPYPTPTFTLNTLVVSVAGAPVASVPGLAVSGSDVTVTVAELGATSFTVTPNTAPNNDGGSFTLYSAPGMPLAGPITATGGTATFIVHAVSPTLNAADAPTISIVDANGTTATLAAVVGP